MQHFCDDVLERNGAIIHVTPVPLACAARQSLNADFVWREALLERMSAMRDVLKEFNGISRRPSTGRTGCSEFAV